MSKIIIVLNNVSMLGLWNKHAKEKFFHGINSTWILLYNWSLPTTVGSRSTNTALGTCFPAPVSLKKVLKLSSPPPSILSDGICPSGWIPCSRQYNSQQALPIWTPAWPTCTEIHSRYREHKNSKFVSICSSEIEKRFSKLISNGFPRPSAAENSRIIFVYTVTHQGAHSFQYVQYISYTF